MAESKARVVLVIEGSVQGVFFRASTLEVAQRLGIEGWVRNLADGAVEVVAEGEIEALDELLSWCEEGPPSARVEEVRVRRGPPTGEFSTFQIRG